MYIIKKAYCRCFQGVLRASLPFLPYRNPEVRNKLEEIPSILKKHQIKKPFLITDHQLVEIGATNHLQSILEENQTEFILFDGAFPNPTTDLVEKAAAFYQQHQCDAIIAFGGGSPMDLAKAVGVRIVRPGTPLIKLQGILKVWKKLPTLIAIPTTAGTGSETTLAAVLIDSETRHKFTINDFPLIPRYAVLDPETIHTLPKNIAACTGLDALTHAVEAYIGRSTTKETREYAKEAVSLIFENLDDAVHHRNLDAEKNMLLASHLAGRAFTRSYVGYIHAVSHSLSGKYNLPHGLVNAILLPIVLRKYGDAVTKKLAELAVCAKLGGGEENEKTLAEKFITAIEHMNESYEIPNYVKQIEQKDIAKLAEYADQEANPLYPVPVLWNAKELEEIYREVSRTCGKEKSRQSSKNKKVILQQA